MTQLPNSFPPIAAALPAEDQIDLLRAMGDITAADSLQEILDEQSDGITRGAQAYDGAAEALFGGLFALRAWQHSDHAFGYFPLLPADGAVPATMDIQDAG